MSKTIRIDVKYAKADSQGSSLGLPNTFQFLNQLQEQLDSGSTATIYIHPQVDLGELKYEIEKQYTNHEGLKDISCSEGVLQGCYGSNTGKHDPGLTLKVDSSLFPTRFIDDDFDEIVNIESLMNEHGELMDTDAEAVHESMEALGIEGKGDNTYNYLGNNYHEPVALCTVDFTLYLPDGNDLGDPCIVVAKFHHGGDVRGNYGPEHAYKFESLEDAYSALHPRLEYIDEEVACDDDFQSLKQDLWKLKGKDREQAIQKLRIMNQGGE